MVEKELRMQKQKLLKEIDKIDDAIKMLRENNKIRYDVVSSIEDKLYSKENTKLLKGIIIYEVNRRLEDFECNFYDQCFNEEFIDDSPDINISNLNQYEFEYINKKISERMEQIYKNMKFTWKE